MTDGDDVRPVYPLFPDMPIGSVEYIIAQRVIDDSAARPGSDKRTRYQVWPERFDPITTDEVTIAERCGGGIYDLRAVGAKGRTVGGMRIEIMGEPKEFVSSSASSISTNAVQSTAPHAPRVVEQAAPGVLAVRGLDPNVQAMLAMIQANNERIEKQLEAQRLALQQEAQRVREDAKLMNETMVRMVEATVKATAPQTPLDHRMMLRWMDHLERQLERTEKRARQEKEAKDDDGDGQLFESIIEKAPAALAALPALQSKLAELMAPMFRDHAKEIVKDVLAELPKNT
jgi:hypothetical protein